VTSVSVAMNDSVTMLRRNLRHMLRYPSMSLILAGFPVVFLLLFVYVFGGTLGAGLSGVPRNQAGYVAFVVPGILLLAVAAEAQVTAISVATDMKEGIIARFRAMDISRGSVLAGHVLGSVLQAMISVAVVVGVGLLIGFRPAAGLPGWLAVAGLLALASLALSWLSVGCGLWAKTPEGASNLPMFLTLLPFLGSGFVPTASMSAGLRWFAEYQPFTPIINTLRGLLLGTPVGRNGIIAVGWCIALTAAGYAWSRMLYRRHAMR
jgi:ABC-2 type transport system permease protein